MTYIDNGEVAPADRSAHLEMMIAAVPPENRPPAHMACRHCARAHWVRDGDTLRCLCLAGHFLTWPRLAIEDCTGRIRAQGGNDKAVSEHLDRMISAVPAADRPADNIICRRHCPMAMWTREGRILRCFCHIDGVRTWPDAKLDACSHWPAHWSDDDA